MCGSKENFPATCKNGYNIRVRIILGCVPQIFFHAIFLVKTSSFVEFIDENELSAILNHTMTGIALECKDRIVRIFPEKADEVAGNGYALSHTGLLQDFLLLKFKAKTSHKLFKSFKIIVNGLQVFIHRNISVLRFANNFVYLIEY